MKARPILFSGPMVRANLAGSKTQTRRIVKRAIPEDADEVFFWSGEDLRAAGHRNVAETGLWARKNGRGGYLRYLGPCPHGVPGDLLWVKERLARAPDLWTYVADGSEVGFPGRRDLASKRLDYAPSIHMPKVASRLTLEITQVRVERLQDISEADAQAEGISTIWPRKIDGSFSGTGPNHFTLDLGDDGHINAPTPSGVYEMLWGHINGEESWASNPWVWAVSFAVHKQHVDTLLRERGAA